MSAAPTAACEKSTAYPAKWGRKFDCHKSKAKMHASEVKTDPVISFGEHFDNCAASISFPFEKASKGVPMLPATLYGGVEKSKDQSTSGGAAFEVTLGTLGGAKAIRWGRRVVSAAASGAADSTCEYLLVES